MSDTDNLDSPFTQRDFLNFIKSKEIEEHPGFLIYSKAMKAKFNGLTENLTVALEKIDNLTLRVKTLETEKLLYEAQNKLLERRIADLEKVIEQGFKQTIS